MFFIYEVSAKFFSIFLSVIMFFSGLAIETPGTNNNDGNVKIGYEFANDDELSAAGTVSVSAKLDGKYKLYWGDEDGKMLKETVNGFTASYTEFATVEVDEGSGEAEVLPFTAIPDNAETVVAYKNNIRLSVMELPDEKTHESEEELYRFGALSDVHFNRYYLSLMDDSTKTFPNALSLLDKFGVKLVGISGDISNDGEEDAFRKYNHYASKYDFPVYTCTGNHDVHNQFVKENWLNYMNTGVYGEEKADGVVNVGSNNMDFVYAPDDVGGDVFIFLCQYAWSYNNENARILTDEQLDWLTEQLEKYSDRRVYLFFHTFLANDDGDKRTGQGNVLNSNDCYYNLVFTQGTADEIRFRSLLKTYKNVIFFNGHSHFAFDMQKYNSILNITDYDGQYATLVHIPSVSSPRRMTDTSKDYHDCNLRVSEGYLVRVYDDHIVLTGVDFLKGQFISYATFLVNK